MFSRITLLNQLKQSALMENYFDTYTFEKSLRTFSLFFESHAFLFIPASRTQNVSLFPLQFQSSLHIR